MIKHIKDLLLITPVEMAELACGFEEIDLETPTEILVKWDVLQSEIMVSGLAPGLGRPGVVGDSTRQNNLVPVSSI